jgi:hypothetical protein
MLLPVGINKINYMCDSGHIVFHHGNRWVHHPLNWNYAMKLILKRDKYSCQICGYIPTIKKNNHVHHIDYDRSNSDDSNLITLCASCHGKTNTKNMHSYWTKHLRQILSKKYGYNYPIHKMKHHKIEDPFKNYSSKNRLHLELELTEEENRDFRIEATKKFTGKGELKKAAEEALKDWIKKQQGN